MIKISHLSKKYDGVQIINEISLELQEGQITVLIGPSGSGKTTLLKSISLLESPDSGTIQLDENIYEFPNGGKKIRSQFKYSGSQQVGVVFQNLDLIPHWTNRQNILYPLNNGQGEKYSAELDMFVSKFIMQSFIDKYPKQCSRGEQQRVAFVRAVMLRPKYLFLDEITSALDVELVAILFRFLVELKKDGTSIFIITHHLPFAKNVADNIIFLKKGSVIESGSSEIMSKPKTPELKSFMSSLDGIIINVNEK